MYGSSSSCEYQLRGLTRLEPQTRLRGEENSNVADP